VLKVFRLALAHKKTTVVLLIIIAGIVIYSVTRPSAASRIQTQTVKKNDLTQTLSVTGSVDSTKSVDLSFQTGGKLVYLNAKLGDHVKAGQTIAMLDEQTVQKNLESALEDYNIERNTFDQDYENNNAKNPDDGVSDAIRRTLQNDQYTLDKSVIAVQLQNLAEQNSVLTTPIAGIVTRADVDTTGVNVTTTTTFTVTDPNGLVFKMEVDEADVGNVKVGQPIGVTLDAYPDQTLHLKVDSIDFASHITSTGGTAYYVWATLPASRVDTYRVGMNGDADITLHKVKNVMTVPISSVINNTYVYVKKGNTFKRTKVKLGLANDTQQEVIKGLQVGDKVALDPTQAENVK
jgi:RND family efflux transporter MFP subunit